MGTRGRPAPGVHHRRRRRAGRLPHRHLTRPPAPGWCGPGRPGPRSAIRRGGYRSVTLRVRVRYSRVTKQILVAEFLRAQAAWRLARAQRDPVRAARCAAALLDAAAFVATLTAGRPGPGRAGRGPGVSAATSSIPGRRRPDRRWWQFGDPPYAGPRDLLTALAAAVSPGPDALSAAASRAARPVRPAAGGPAPRNRPAGPPRGAGTPARPRPWRRGPGPGPAQARTRVSSPLRNRWQRTPPVARPLAGYSRYGVTFTVAAAVPGSAPLLPATVTTTASPASPGAPPGT